MQALRAGLALVLLAAVTSLLPAQGAYDEVVKQTLGLLGRINDKLESIKDKDSAEAARPDLGKLAVEWAELRKKAKELPPPERVERDELKKHKSDLRKAVARLGSAVTRVQNIDGGRLALQEISGILKKLDE
jgi:hypothetical protein